MNLIKKLLLPLLISGFVLLFFINFLIIYYSKNLPDIKEIINYTPKTVTKINDRDKKLIGLFYDEKREYRDLKRIPLIIKHAFISAEDKNFFEHSGYDIYGYFKALIGFINDGKLRGASTITQQITKGFLLSGERTFERKIKEFILALRLEDALSKNEILELYLNEVYLGENSYGVVAASKTYFSKNLDELSPSEAAYLASLPKSPGRYNPKSNISNAIQRRNFVLKEMFQNGFITNKIFNDELQKDLITNFNKIPSVKENYSILEGFIADEINSDVNIIFESSLLSRGNYIIETSLDLSLQNKTYETLKNELIDLDKKNNIFQPPISHVEITNQKTINWKSVFSDNKVKNNINNWNLGVIVNEENGNFLLKTSNFDKLNSIVFPYSDPVNFSVGDIVYYKKNKNDKDFIYQQIPYFDGGILVLDRNSHEVLALNGGFHYNSSNLNMVTEKKENFKKALYPFLFFIMLEQQPFFKSKNDLTSVFAKHKEMVTDIYLNNLNLNPNALIIDKEKIQDQGLYHLKKIEEKNYLLSNKETFILNTSLTLYELMNYYKILLSDHFFSKTKLLKKISKNNKEIFNSNDFKRTKVNSYKEDLIFFENNEKYLKFLGLKKILLDTPSSKKRDTFFYGWDYFDDENGYDLFIGYDEKNIVVCFINIDVSNKKVSKDLINNSCIKPVKEIFKENFYTQK